MTTRSEFSKGDLVSVAFPDKAHSEMGTVVKVGCTWEEQVPPPKGSSSAVLETIVRRCDGISVLFAVENCTKVVPPEAVTRAEAHPSPSSARPQSRQTRSRRAAVTPSPSTTKTSAVSVEPSWEEEKKPPAKRKRRTKDTNHLPAKEAASGKKSSKTNQRKDNNAEATSSKYFQDRRQADTYEEESVEEEASNLIPICLPVARAGSKKKGAANKRRPAPLLAQSDDSSDAEEKSESPDDDDDEAVQDNVEDNGEQSSEDEDRPFSVEYAVSSRSTCRRCDSIIQKGVVRVSHVPIFRGKPGFRVYRHLACAVFSEEVQTIRDVGGWRLLNKEDQARLQDRIEESAREVEKENEELRPDELVQAAFSGEIRPSPPGLVANLLPFQTEGFSWMRHQEKGGGQVRGGILADEMGMVRCLESLCTYCCCERSLVVLIIPHLFTGKNFADYFDDFGQ